MTYFDQIKNQVQERIDDKISSLSEFLDKEQTYRATILPDPLHTGKIWFIELSIKNLTSSFLIGCILDADEKTSLYVRSQYVLLLQSMGYSIVDEEDQEFEFSERDIETMSSMMDFFNTKEDILIDNDYKNKEFHIVCSHNEEQYVFAVLDSISARGAWVLAKQLTMLIAGLGKFVESPDDTIGNRYGIVEFIPNIVGKVKGIEESPKPKSVTRRK